MTKSYELTLNKQGDVAPVLGIKFPKIGALIVAISYGGGLWANIQHELEGAYEANELPPVLHWLRDSTLAMIFIFFAVLAALAFSRWLIQRVNGRISPLAQQMLIVVALGVFTGAAFAIGIPIHTYLFGAHGAGHASVIVDMLQDGSKIALVNIGISALMMFTMGGLD